MRITLSTSKLRLHLGSRPGGVDNQTGLPCTVPLARPESLSAFRLEGEVASAFALPAFGLPVFDLPAFGLACLWGAPPRS